VPCRRTLARYVLVEKVLTETLTAAARVLIYAAASFAAMRLDHLVGADPKRIGSAVHLTPRELAVLCLLSSGASLKSAAEMLGLGEETVRSHSKKVQAKLGARNRAEAVAEAIRQHDARNALARTGKRSTSSACRRLRITGTQLAVDRESRAISPGGGHEYLGHNRISRSAGPAVFSGSRRAGRIR
jgi:DNA-binding CsgD family transcriptional regulator